MTDRGRTIQSVAAAFAVGLGCGGADSTDAGLSGSADETAAVDDDGSGAASISTSDGGSATQGSQDGTQGSTMADDTAADSPIFDVGAIGDVPGEDCECGFDDWSYLFVSNSAEATLSKINTRTLTEEGRYRTRPDGSGNPSRTSVSIDGRAVVVANRMGGVTKFWARPELCDDANGNGMIDTSSGPADIKAFADEECVAWHTPFPEATTQRPVAWTSGSWDRSACEYTDQKVWTAAANGTPGAVWPCDGAPGIVVYLLNGDTGAVEQEIPMPDVSCGGTFGPYGGAVDFENDLWMYVWSAFTIVHVDFETFEYETISGGSYGITVDNEGRVWVDSGQRYDPATMTWASKIPANGLPGSGGSGVSVDLQGRVWTATQGGVGWIDAETMMVGDTVPLPEGGLYRGMAVDIDGYIWAVMLGGTTAHRIDP
ncbi:MAG TPA: hypothetical protein VFG69_20115, partial [Nannocystaceae bacterium]|nr:hypothetical protein [Nannocystaceae bacterium]